MYRKTQQGKGLFNFMAGSIVALAAIAGVLFMLDKNSTRDFKQPQLAGDKPATPEVLSPNGNANPAPQITPTPESAAVVASVAMQPAPVATNAKAVEPIADTQVQAASAVVNKPVAAAKPRTAPTLAPKPSSRSYDPVLGEEDSAAVSNPEEIRPTAEQILDNGSLQKAREVAQREARERRARQAAVAQEKARQNKATTAEQATSNERSGVSHTPTAQKQPASTERSSLQAGAYQTRQAADEQRAKLALMGVQTKIVPVQSNGKTMYRVQTNPMDSAQANQVKQRLQSKGVDTITRH